MALFDVCCETALRLQLRAKRTRSGHHRDDAIDLLRSFMIEFLFRCWLELALRLFLQCARIAVRRALFPLCSAEPTPKVHRQHRHRGHT
jgi:hypothetical protein